MKYLIEIDEKEMDAFLDIFFNGVTVPVSLQSAAEKRLANKVSAVGAKYENDRMAGVK